MKGVHLKEQQLTTGPKTLMKQTPDDTVKVVLEEARDRASVGGDRVLGFGSAGVVAGTKLRVFLLALSMGGRPREKLCCTRPLRPT